MGFIKEMKSDKETTAAIDKGVYIINRHQEVKTTPEFTPSFNVEKIADHSKKKTWYSSSAPTALHFTTLVILGLLTWGLLWLTLGDGWRWNGEWFRLAMVYVVAWGSGQLLQSVTTLPPLLAALLTGILARHLGILDMRQHTHIDAFLRKIYPVMILGKGSLGWNVKYMKNKWQQIAALGVLPWAAEVVTVAVCTNQLLDFPWTWGFLLGTIYSSVSCPVIMPPVLRIGAGSQNWPQLVCTAGGIDTALSVGVYGIIYSFMFADADHVYRYTKVALTLPAGVALGVMWGSLAKLVPHSQDFYVTELRVLLVLAGGLFANFLTSYLGWVGAGGVAVLACNATAASHWEKDGWKLNKNPASTAYRVLWAACEPMVFAYTGTFFVIDSSIVDTMVLGIGILVICLVVRLTVTAAVCWDLSFKERVFMCCAWIPKSIVEAVLCPLALDTVILQHIEDHNVKYAMNLIRLIVQATIITTPIGFLLTNNLGPYLLKNKKDKSDCENDAESQKRKSVYELEDDA